MALAFQPTLTLRPATKKVAGGLGRFSPSESPIQIVTTTVMALKPKNSRLWFANIGCIRN